MFHPKCVSLNKTTLNAITSCPNAHWLCHECNDGNKMIGKSIINMSETVESLKNSLTSDLLAGFKLLTETLSSSLLANHGQKPFIFSEKNPNSNTTKRRREETIVESELEGEFTTRNKRFATTRINKSNQSATTLQSSHKSNDEPRSMVAALDPHRRKSIVISNISKGISPEYICKYLSNELCINESAIRATSLKPAGITDENIKFLQFRISVPENIYSKARASETWPTGVRIRDYVFNRRGGNVPTSVVREDFLSKCASHKTIDQQPAETWTLNATNTPKCASEKDTALKSPTTDPTPINPNETVETEESSMEHVD